MEMACGGKRRHGLVQEIKKKKKKAKQLFGYETVEGRAVTQCFYRAAHLFSVGALEGL